MKKYLVNVSVADLRREPTSGSTYMAQDLLQETQLLFNEQLKGFHINNGWVYVEAIEQQKYLSDGGWQGYPGWVKADQLIEVEAFDSPNLCVSAPWAVIFAEPDRNSTALVHISLGTHLVGIEECEQWWQIKMPDGTQGAIQKQAVRNLLEENSVSWRNEMVTMGKQLLNTPYMWGGRSAYRKDWSRPFTSVDCSSFIELLFRIQGKRLPRDAHDQFLQCPRKESHQLEVADLIFLAETKKPSRVSHVMLYLGDDNWIEAEMEAKKVRVVSSKKKLGVSIKNLPWGHNNGEYLIYFSSSN